MIYEVNVSFSKEEISLAQFDVDYNIKDKMSEHICKLISSEIPIRLKEVDRWDIEVHTSKFYLEDINSMNEKMKKIKEFLSEEDYLKVIKVLND
jgi:mevalonate pyrophosphate decarboxylase